MKRLISFALALSMLAGMLGSGISVSADNNTEITPSNASGTLVITLKIKADIQPSVTLEGWMYGDTPNTPSVTGNDGGGAVTYYYKVKGAEDSTYTETKPTAAGNYTVKAVIAETDDYKSGSATADFTIANYSTTLTITLTIKPSITPTVSLEGWMYGDTPNTPSVTGNDGGGDVTYYYKAKDADDSTYTEDVPKAAGNYTVKAVIAETDDYKSGSATADFTIANYSTTLTITLVIKEKATATAPTANELTYNGQEQPLVTAGTAIGGTMQYKLGENGTYSETIPKATNAGSYTVYYKAVGDNDHQDSDEDSVDVTIGQAAVTVTANAQSKTFGDADPELTYTAVGLAGNDKLTGALSRAEGNDVGEYDITAGTLTVPSDNYTLGFTGAKLTINAKDIADAVISLEANEIEYTGNELAPNVTEVTLGQTVLTGDDYEIDAESDTKGTNYGTYTLTVKGKGNYTGTASKEWKITKTLPTVAELPTASTIRTGSALSTSTLTGGKMLFNGEEVPGTFAWADGTIMPTVDDSDKTEYDVVFTPDDMDNFAPVTVKITLTVKKRSSGGGSSSSGSTYAVTTSKTTNGTIKSSTYNAASGTKVTLTVTPKDGYEVDTVTITDKDGNPVEVTKNADGTYSYVQPASKVTIDATYKEAGAEPTASPAPTAEPQPTDKPSGDKDWWFKDVPDSTWYYAPIKEAFDAERMSGMSEDYFEPETDITRGMFAYAIYRREGLPATDAQNKFEDVKADTYYEKAIAWATENGIVAGIDDTHYAPDDQITREQMAAILYRYAQFKAYDVSVGEDTNILDFTDAQDISEYAIPAIQWAVGDSVITGFEDGTMRPKSNANRAQMAVILNKIADLF